MYRTRAFDYLKSWEEHQKKSNSASSYNKKWLKKCFHHFLETFKDVDKQTEEKLLSLLESINIKYSEIEKTIDKYAKIVRDNITNAKSDGKSPLEFGLYLSKVRKENPYYDIEIIPQLWTEFFQKFIATFEDIIEETKANFQERTWHKSLTKIHQIYKRTEKSFCTFDYHCLKEKVCIICNKKSHRIDFDETLAKMYPLSYTYHGNSEKELSDD